MLDWLDSSAVREEELTAGALSPRRDDDDLDGDDEDDGFDDEDLDEDEEDFDELDDDLVDLDDEYDDDEEDRPRPGHPRREE